MNQATLYLADGSIWPGKAFGATGTRAGELVFNTSMTGYQEILTDLSYYGQIVTMTYPLIGNYGVNPEDPESLQVAPFGLVVREHAEHPSNWRTAGTIDDYLVQAGVIGISEVDTRAIAKRIRSTGAMKAVLTTENLPQAEVERLLTTDLPHDQVARVTTKQVYRVPASGPRVAVVDFGMKLGLLRGFVERGCDLTVFPASASFEQIAMARPDGVFLTNGPGDPADLVDAVQLVKQCAERYPVFGVCMGHQLLSLAFGAKTAKMKFGHRGANHSVKDLDTGRVYMTSQNHGYQVVKESLDDTELRLTHLHVNDDTVEGVRHRHLPAFSVQYHPEARPGPMDSHYLFDEFMSLIRPTEGGE
ncbi:MAG: carbamoyl-phosphate synthase small subunit [Bacilli bacterium]|nr:carbamoyl-phosphate synthase small subunit [Bacilli bacterium]